MSINSTHSDNTSALSDEPRLVNLRFSLRRLLSKTALADIYWSNDLHGVNEEMPEKNVLVLLVNPAITRLQGFPHAWQQVLSRPAPSATAYPDMIAFGEDKGDYWLALDNISGMLLSERINELDDRGLPLDIALDTLENINQTLSSIQAGAYGHIEPGAIQQTDRGYKILNAPLVKVLQQIVATERSTINKLALHSPYLSPSVAVGDIPVTEDDSFSTASVLYTLLAGKSPFGEQSTLTAVAHGDTPPPLTKLKKPGWEAIQQALAYQRSARPENPEKLLGMLKKSNKRRIAFPLAVLTALGVTVFAGQHLVSRLTDYLPSDGPEMPSAATKQDTQQSSLIASQATSAPIPTTSTEPADTKQQPLASVGENKAADDKKAEAIAAIELVNEPETETSEIAAPESQTKTLLQTELETDPVTQPETRITQAETDNTDTSDPSPETPLSENNKISEAESRLADTSSTESSPETTEKTDQLLKRAITALNNGQLDDASDGGQGAISLLRETLRIDEDNADATVLLGKVVDKRYQAAEQQIGKNDFAAAEALLGKSDELIREFVLTDKLQRQVRLESKITILRQEQKQIDELLVNARAAIKRGDISKDDSSSANALAYLSRIMFKQPGNEAGRQLIDDIVALRQQATRQSLDNFEIEQAGTYLGESERLIRKYKLQKRSASQQALELAYQAATTQPQAAAVEQINENVEIITLTPESGNSTQTGQQPLNTGNFSAINQSSANLQPVPALEATATLPTNQQAMPNNELAVEKLEPNSIGIQASRIEEINHGSEVLQPDQVFIPEATSVTANTQEAPIWEADDLQQIRQNDQAVVIYDPNTSGQQTGQITSVAPQQNNSNTLQSAPTQPVVSYTTSNQPQSANAQNFDVLPDDLPIIVQQDQLQELPVVAEFLPPVTAADQQAMANVQAPLGEVIPELQEIPISDIEEILPAQ